MESRGHGQLTSAAAGLNACICRQRDIAVAGQHAGPKAAHAGDGRIGEQDGKDRLGVDGARRDPQNSGYGGIKPVAVARRPGRQDAVDLWCDCKKYSSRDIS